MKKVAIQGIPGSFHEIAARNFFFQEEIGIVPCRTFSGLFNMVAANPGLYGIAAVENSLAGTILPNLTLLKASGLSIIGECKLRIGLNLLALPGQSISDIREVISHPVALMQCEEFFRLYPGIKLSESDDTAMSALEMSKTRTYGLGVVASAMAAKLYNLTIVANGIETNKRNFTRFFILSGNPAENHLKQFEKAGTCKVSIVFSLAHQPGKLSEVLTMLAKHGCNLMMIQSNPVIGREWEYLFYIDLVSSDYNSYRQAMKEMNLACNYLRILGVYPEGKVCTEDEVQCYDIIDTEEILKQWNR